MNESIVVPIPEQPPTPEVNVTIINAEPANPEASAPGEPPSDQLSLMTSRLASLEAELTATKERLAELEAEVEDPETEPEAVLAIPVPAQESSETTNADEVENHDEAAPAKPRHRWF